MKIAQFLLILLFSNPYMVMVYVIKRATMHPLPFRQMSMLLL